MFFASFVWIVIIVWLLRHFTIFTAFHVFVSKYPIRSPMIPLVTNVYILNNIKVIFAVTEI